jgi:hypothetical protein
MNNCINEEYDDTLYPLTDKFEKVNEINYLEYAQVANIQYHYLVNNINSNGYHFVNWRVNYGNLHDFVIENSKLGVDISTFLKYYEESAPILYNKLGLEY